MTDKTCDLTFVRAETMRLAQAGAKRLKLAGVPITSGVFGELVRDSHRKAVQACQPADLEITPDQAKVVADLCQPCSRFYRVRAQASLDMEAEAGEEQQEEAEEEAEGQV